MTRRRKPTVDERTAGMTLEALECRRLGHAWNELPQGRTRRAALRTQGQDASVIKCARCTLTVIEVTDLETYDVISRKPEGGYPPGYLAPKGSGRLPRREARKAYAVRRSGR